ncbi:metallophosphoesterase [Myxococcota bacterium]|nr:metallophosphoesterase [Myxococcota bacterium]
MNPLLILCIPLLLGQTGPAPARRQDPLARDPYVQNVTPTALSILWETHGPETCKIRLRSLVTADSWEQASGPGEHHEVRFEGLVPSSRYEYTVTTGSGPVTDVVRTAPGPMEPFTFLVYGDTRHGHGIHRQLVRVLEFDQASFVLHTGDFVDDGLKKSNWYRFFTISNPLMRRVPLYPTVGNHENAFERGLELYRRFFAVPDDGPQPEVVYAFTWGNSRFFVLNANKPFVGAPQTAWLRTQLKEAAANPQIRHLFVSVHHSPYTSGPHGPQQELLDSGLVDDMRRYGVDMLFAGHDHMYERGRVDGLNYAITAGGGAPIYYIKHNHPYSLVTEPTYNYARVVVQGDLIEFSAHRMDGSLLDYVHLRRQKPARDMPPRIEVVREYRKEAPMVPATPPPTPPPFSSMRPDPVSPGNDGFPWLFTGLLAIAAGLAGLGAWLGHRRRRR